MILNFTIINVIKELEQRFNNSEKAPVYTLSHSVALASELCLSFGIDIRLRLTLRVVVIAFQRCLGFASAELSISEKRNDNLMLSRGVAC